MGATHYSHRGIEANSKYSAFKLMVNEKMLRHIQHCTELKGKTQIEDWKFSLYDLESFIGLSYARGVLAKGRNPARSLWSEKWGISIFKKQCLDDVMKKSLSFYALM